MENNERTNQMSAWGAASDAAASEDESSALFSLKALRERAEAERAKEQAKPSCDDSGLIDLYALGLSLKSVPATVQVAPLGPPILPLDSDLPKAEADIDIVFDKPVKAGKRAWVAGAALVAAALGVLGFGLHAATEEQVQAAETGIAKAALEVPSPAMDLPRSETKADEPSADERAAKAPSSEVKADPEKTEAPKKPVVAKTPVVKAQRPAPVKQASVTKTEEPEKPQVEQKKPAPVDPCHGDLMCAMKRATGG